MKAGSLINHLAANNPASQPEPVIGMGATHYLWTDREAYTICDVINPWTIQVQPDNATRKDGNGMSENQDYEFTPNPEADKTTLTLRKDGKWYRKGESMKGSPFIIGHRDKYHDYSF